MRPCNLISYISVFTAQGYLILKPLKSHGDAEMESKDNAVL